MESIRFLSGHIWIYVILLGLGIGITVRHYLRYDVSLWRRWGLIALRVLILLLLCNLASEPVIQSYYQEVQPHILTVLLDTSASMGFMDGGRTRWDETRTTLDSWELPEAVDLRLYGFSTYLHPISDIETTRPNGLTTDITGALREALDQLQAQRPATLLVVSDGIHNQGGSPVEVAQRAHDMRIPIHTALIGGGGPPDVRIEAISAADVAFKGSEFSIAVDLHQQGYDSMKAELSVRRITASGKATLVEVTDVSLTGPNVRMALSWQPQSPGLAHYRVAVAPLPGETVLRNNRLDLYVEVVEHPLRVLYLEAHPRWEYRFLRNAMERDPRIRLQTQLTEAPFDTDAIEGQDLIILGDVAPEQIARAADLIRQFVDSGGGLLWMAGPRSPGPLHAYGPLAVLLPVELAAGIRATGVAIPAALKSDPLLSLSEESYLPELTIPGMRHPISAHLADHLRSEKRRLPEFHWYAGASLKPTAVVLLVHPTRRMAGKPLPLLAYQYYGKGRVLFAGFDETWRWRKGVGDTIAYGFWSGAVQWLALPHRLGSSSRVELSTDRRQYEQGTEIHIFARMLDRAGVGPSAPELTVSLLPGARTIPLQPRAGEPGNYEGVIEAPGAGEYLLRLTTEGASTERVIRVKPPTLEWRDLSADSSLLRQIATVSGGTFHEQLAPLRIPLEPKVMELRSNRSLWDNMWTLLAVISLLTMEWMLKRQWYLI